MPKPLRVRYTKIDRLIDDLLARHRVAGPPIPVESIIASAGIEISHKTLDGDLAGFLLRREGCMTIGVNGKHSPARQRFTLAHELGHALLHDGNELHLDHGFRVNLRSQVSAATTDLEEIEANAFAATLLMPARMLRRDLEAGSIDVEDDDQVALLAQSYGVSRTAMTFRLMNLFSRSW